MEESTKTISKPNTLFPKFEWDVSMLRSFYIRLCGLEFLYLAKRLL